MSLAVVFKSPEGLVLAADSRITLTSTVAGKATASFFDNATKLLSLQSQKFIGIATYGTSAIGQHEPRTAHSYLSEFEEHLTSIHADARLEVETVAQLLSDFYMDRWTIAGMPAGFDPMIFLVSGFDPTGPYGRVFQVKVPTELVPVEQNAGTFGLTWGGMGELLGRLLGGTDPRAAELAKSHLGLTDIQTNELREEWKKLGLPIPYQFLPLQDCVDLSTFLVNMTAAVQGWMIGIRGVGGDVDVATITRTEGLTFLQQKRLEVTIG